MYSKGKMRPRNEIGHIRFGFIKGDKYAKRRSVKLIEFIIKRNLLRSDNFFIYFLLALNNESFSSLDKLS